MKFLILAVLVTAIRAELGSILDSEPSKVTDEDARLFGSKAKAPAVKTGGPLDFLAPQGPFATGTLKAAAAIPVKTIATKKVAAAKVLSAPKLKAAALKVPVKAALKKPSVHSLKPIVYVVEKPVKVYHRVPVPKKVMVPKFYPVYKKVPVPKIIPVPFKVPIKKIIPKIVKIPKAIPVPKIVPVKKPVPIAIPYPVFKTHRFPVPKPVPYAKYIPIPIKKKVPKFIPVPIKKIIKVPKPYYVPVRVPHFSASYLKTPMAVNVPDIKKPSWDGAKLFQGGKMSKNVHQSFPKDSEKFSVPNLGKEDEELLKMLTKGAMAGDDKPKI